MVEPVAAFVTFNSQEGFERCINHMGCTKDLFEFPVYNPSGSSLRLLGEEQEVFEASEPSDIIWENLEISVPRLNCNIFFAAFGNLAVLAVILLGVIVLKTYSTASAKQFPISNNCDVIDGRFASEE